MTDEPLDPSRFLASAALDDEVTADERAQVDASPELTEELAFYAQVRGQLADVEVPPQARDAAISAALAAFDENPGTATAPATGSPPATASVVSINQRRRTQYRWLGGAAAAAVVAIVGIGALAQNRSDDDSSTAFAPSGSNADTAAKLPALEVTAGDSADTSAAYDSSAAGATPASGAEAASAESSPELTSIEGAAAVSPWMSAPAFDSTEQLSQFVDSPSFGTTEATTSPQPQPPIDDTPTTASAESGSPAEVAPMADAGSDAMQRSALAATCGIDQTLPSALVVYVGQNALVVRDDTRNEAVVYAQDTCRVLATIDLG